MVQERTLPKSEDDLSGIEIVDNTPPAVDAQIAKEEQAAGVTPPETSETAPSPEQVETPKEEVQQQQPVTPQKRVYSDEEWNKRQSALDKRVAEIEAQRQRDIAEERRQRQALEARLAEFDLNAQVEAYRQNEERRLSATLEPDTARAQASLNAEARKAQIVSQREVERARMGQAEAANLVKLAAADRIRADFGLLTDDIDYLMSARSLDDMIGKAKNLAARTKREEAKARVPNGQRAESPVSPGRGALTHDELMDIYNSGDDSNPRYTDAAGYVANLMQRRR